MRDEPGRWVYMQPPVLHEGDLVAFLETQGDIVAAYLFGSLAQGRAHPRSDVDIAILLSRVPDEPGGTTDRQLQLMGEFRRFADREVDVVMLNTASPIPCHQVLRGGKLLHEGNRAARVDFEVRAGKIYADLQPMRDYFSGVLLAEIREVGLGGRRRARTADAAAK